HVYPHETSKSTTGQNLVTSKAQISKPAPDWEGTAVINGEFKELKLEDFRGKYLVFFFYPLDFTFVCPTEIIAFSDRLKEFQALKTEVVACSVDSPFTHLAWMNTPRKLGGLGPINIPLLSDLSHKISKDYGVFLEDLGHTLSIKRSTWNFSVEGHGKGAMDGVEGALKRMADTLVARGTDIIDSDSFLQNLKKTKTVYN
ncbi:Peroxiredoxin-4, partial [Araneus ventricosus]